jgi:NDP-hexose-3-ketoreductase|tara:strand:+ start:635 stop:1510 length:876 start_codon:yes stop_codon:yes gene_type:complete
LTKIGLIGHSSISRRSVIPAIQKSNDFDLGNIGTRDNRSGYSYQDILDSDVDSIYVSLPVGLHYEWGKKVLESGKHLLLEKTFTTSLDEGKELFDIAESSNLNCMEALMYQFHPLQKQIKDLLPRLGKIRCVEAHFGFPHLDNKKDIRYQKNLGGGAKLDCLVYPLSFVFDILGYEYDNFQELCFWDDDIDARGYIMLEFQDSLANISYGFGHSYRNEILIWGEDSILKVKRVFSRPEICDEKIEISKNGVTETFEVKNSDHFLNMLSEFKNPSVDLKKNTLKRLDFMGEF